MEELKAFLQLPHIHKADEWLELFHSEPPRGVLVRLARRLSVDLHPTNQCWQYKTLAAFNDEIDRMQSWYEPGKKQWRWHKGIVRNEDGGKKVQGLVTVFNKSVKQHYKNLRNKVKQQGLCHGSPSSRHSCHHRNHSCRAKMEPPERYDSCQCPENQPRMVEYDFEYDIPAGYVYTLPSSSATKLGRQ